MSDDRNRFDRIPTESQADEIVRLMDESHKKEMAVMAAFECAQSIAALTKGCIADALNHHRAARAYAGVLINRDLLTEWEHRAYQAFRMVMTIADQPCSPEVEGELIDLAWSVLRTLDGEVIARAEMLRDYVEVPE